MSEDKSNKISHAYRNPDMKNKSPTVFCCFVLFLSSALAQESGLIAHGAEVVEVQGGFGFLA